jgi:septal ring factor EnvC (AmiA/AmiB activator)
MVAKQKVMEVGILGLAGGVVATFATAATTWLFSRRQAQVETEKLQQEIETMRTQRKADVKSAEVEIMEKYREMYTKMLDDVSEQLTHLKADNEAIRKENIERRDYNEEVRRELKSVHVELEDTRKQLANVLAELESMKQTYPCSDCPRRLSR